MAEAFEVKASARFIPISAQKARLVVDVVRGMDATEALSTLQYMPHKAAKIVRDVVKSAVANADENFGLQAEELVISRIFVDEGPRHRKAPYGGRFAGRGRFRKIMRRSSHITVVLAERDVVEYGDF